MSDITVNLIWTTNDRIALKIIASETSSLLIPLPFEDMPTAILWLDEHMPRTLETPVAIVQIYQEDNIFGTGPFQGSVNFGYNDWSRFLTALDRRMIGYSGEPHENDDYILKISPNPYHRSRPQWEAHQAECRRYAETQHTTWMPA